MDDLIKALHIFRKYGNPQWPTHCEHDVLMVMIDPADVDSADVLELETLGFLVDNEYFKSYKFGSA